MDTVPAINKEDTLSTEVVTKNQKRVQGAKERLVTWSHLADFYNWAFLFGAETFYDMNKAPENYREIGWDMGKTTEFALDPGIKSALDSMGDVLEVSSLHIAGRVTLAAVNEILHTRPAKQVVKTVFGNEKIGGLFAKFLDKETLDRYAASGEIEMSDEARFWISLVPVLMFMGAHSLGFIDFGPNHWHGNDPVPQMLIGQFFAASSLIASHYAVKYPEKVKQIVKSIGGRVKSSSQQLVTLNELMMKMSKDLVIVLKNAGENIDVMLRNSWDAIEERALAGTNQWKQMHEDAVSWLDMETRVMRLMFDEYLDKQLSPFIGGGGSKRGTGA